MAKYTPAGGNVKLSCWWTWTMEHGLMVMLCVIMVVFRWPSYIITFKTFHGKPIIIEYALFAKGGQSASVYCGYSQT